MLRNPLIGKCFFLIKFIEQWGTGTNRIIEACLNHGLAEPLFELLSGSLVVTVRKPRVVEDVLGELNAEELTIVRHIQARGRISRKEGEALLKKSPMTVFRHFKSLEEKGLIAKRGKGRGVYYVLP